MKQICKNCESYGNKIKTCHLIDKNLKVHWDYRKSNETCECFTLKNREFPFNTPNKGHQK